MPTWSLVLMTKEPVGVIVTSSSAVFMDPAVVEVFLSTGSSF